MITSIKYVNYIVETLNVLRQEIISKTGMGLTDDNKYMENFIADILNKVYGYQLNNLNEEKANFPGVDIADAKNSLGFQVTSTRSSSKINESLKKILDHNVYENYNNIKFFILTSKQGTYIIDDFDHNKINFNEKEDILDFDDIYKKCMYLSIDAQRELADYIHQQTPYIAQQIGLDYYNPNMIKRQEFIFDDDKWNSDGQQAEYVIEHNFGYKPNVTILTLDNTMMIAPFKIDEKYVRIYSGGKSFTGKALLT